MSKLIQAHTNPGVEYPGYINFTREADGTVTVYFRGDPVKFEGSYVCGYARDKGLPGRCTPGDDRCNNYCNMAPSKGPMQKHPGDCSHVKPGVDAALKLSAADFAAFIAAAASADEAPDWPPRGSAGDLPEGHERLGSTGQLWRVRGGQWERVRTC